MEKTRYYWPDVMKFIGMFLVFWTHVKIFTSADWDIRPITRQLFPLFFFCAGFFADHLLKLSFWQMLKKLLYQLIVPLFFFTALSYVLLLLVGQPWILPSPAKLFVLTAAGLRDHLLVPASWFLMAFFSAPIVFYPLKKLSLKISDNPRTQTFILLAGTAAAWGLGLYSRAFFTMHEIFGQRELCLPWSFDWGLLFFPYFIAGYLLFPKLKDFHFVNLTNGKKFLWIVICGASLCYLALCLCTRGFGEYGLVDLYENSYLHYSYLTAVSIPMLIAFVTISKFLDKDGLPAKFGRETLLFCCLEIIYFALQLLIQKWTGFAMCVRTELDGIIFVAVKMLILYFVFIPFFKKTVPFFCGIPLKKKPVAVKEA